MAFKVETIKELTDLVMHAEGVNTFGDLDLEPDDILEAVGGVGSSLPRVVTVVKSMSPRRALEPNLVEVALGWKERPQTTGLPSRSKGF